MSIADIDDLVRLYQLKSHPEGGFFAETYRASGKTGDRSHSTAIYFLLPEGAKSRLHRIKSDELWHFYLGGPMTIVEIHPEGKILKTVLGQDVKNGQKLQHVVPAGVWFGSYPNAGTEFSFVGCTVAPGFEFADFEMGSRSRLIQEFPNARTEIEILTD